MQRRDFLKLPLLTATSWPLLVQATTTQQQNQQVILLELKGGNDGLNTLIPYQDKAYYQNRPKLAIPQNKILKWHDKQGVHPAFKPLQLLWDKQQFAWLQGAGYPEQNRSHFRSIEIWDTARLGDEEDLTGWTIPYTPINQDKLKGVVVNSHLGPLFTTEPSVLGLNNLRQFTELGRKTEELKLDSGEDQTAIEHLITLQNSIHQHTQTLLKKLSTNKQPLKPFPKHRLGKDMNTVYSLIAAGVQVPVFKVSLPGFDTHTNQLARHQRLLSQLAETLDIMQQNLSNIGAWENTLILSYSEFGRRLQENANRGTDHGAAAACFALGGRVKGGLYGKSPSLTDLDERGDLKYTIDFRDIYATIAQKWWHNTKFKPINKTLGFI